MKLQVAAYAAHISKAQNNTRVQKWTNFFGMNYCCYIIRNLQFRCEISWKFFAPKFDLSVDIPRRKLTFESSKPLPVCAQLARLIHSRISTSRMCEKLPNSYSFDDRNFPRIHPSGRPFPSGTLPPCTPFLDTKHFYRHPPISNKLETVIEF